jgi:3-methyladenine DNA glycosylase AlkD
VRSDRLLYSASKIAVVLGAAALLGVCWEASPREAFRLADAEGAGQRPFGPHARNSKHVKRQSNLGDAEGLASAIVAEIKSLSVRNTATIRAVRRKFSRNLDSASPAFVLRLATKLCKREEYRWIAYELIQGHKPTFNRIGPKQMADLGKGINSWWTVDSFARTLSGPAWLNRQVPDRLILKWARSTDRWWRRAALVSTVALNVRSHGGKGDVPRTLRICRALANDQDDMVSKALSWALRELVVHDAKAVQDFLDEYDGALAPRVKREVRNKLRTGLKTPKARRDRPLA